MAITKLQLYNIAALAIGETRLSSLTESRELRHTLDEIWDRGKGARWAALEQGFWNFAMRAVKIDKSTSVTPDFGFENAFLKPTDLVRLNMISADENFTLPLDRFESESGYWYANVDPMYVRYVSDDASYGLDMSLWPDSFSLWFGTWLGLQAAPKSMSDPDYKDLQRREGDLLTEARSRDAMQEPTRYPPLSSWAQARLGRGSRRDRGLRSSFTGS